MVKNNKSKKVVKRGSTFHGDNVKHSIGSLINRLVDIGTTGEEIEKNVRRGSEGKFSKQDIDNKIKLRIKIANNIRRYLYVQHMMTMEDIDRKINIEKKKRSAMSDVKEYYRGNKEVSEISNKWNQKPEIIHETAIAQGKEMHEIPNMQTRRFRAEKEFPHGSYMGNIVQEPMYINSVIWPKVKKAYINYKQGKLTKVEFFKYMLDLANRRPEYTAHIGNMMLRDDPYNFTFEGDMKEKMIEILASKRFYENRDPSFRSSIKVSEKDNIDKSKYISQVMKDPSLIAKEKHNQMIEDLKEYTTENQPTRRKKRKKIIAKRPVKRKPHKVVKPIKCRCR